MSFQLSSSPRELLNQDMLVILSYRQAIIILWMIKLIRAGGQHWSLWRCSAARRCVQLTPHSGQRVFKPDMDRLCMSSWHRGIACRVVVLSCLSHLQSRGCCRSVQPVEDWVCQYMSMQRTLSKKHHSDWPIDHNDRSDMLRCLLNDTFWVCCGSSCKWKLVNKSFFLVWKFKSKLMDVKIVEDYIQEYFNLNCFSSTKTKFLFFFAHNTV